MRRRHPNLKISEQLRLHNMKEYIRVDGHQNLYRDSSSEAIVNVDQQEYSQYMQIKEKRRRERDEIENLKNDVSEIKQMLKILVEKIY